MKALVRFSLAAALAIGLVGCKKDEKPAAPAEQQGSEATGEAEEAEDPPAEGEAEPARVPEPQLKVLSVEEHMVEVSKEITADNYKDQLGQLEEQIGRRVDRSAGVVRPAAAALREPTTAPPANRPEANEPPPTPAP